MGWVWAAVLFLCLQALAFALGARAYHDGLMHKTRKLMCDTCTRTSQRDRFGGCVWCESESDCGWESLMAVVAEHGGDTPWR